MGGREQKTGKPVIVGLNKIDMMARNKQQLEQHRQLWRTLLPHAEIQEVSALRGTNVQKLLDRIVAHLPEGPLLYPNNTFTDATERFYASEIIREQLFLNYKKEVPYSCEVVIDQFKDSEDLLSISATIFVARKTQVPIIVGRQGDALKKVLRSASQASCLTGVWDSGTRAVNNADFTSLHFARGCNHRNCRLSTASRCRCTLTCGWRRTGTRTRSGCDTSATTPTP